MGIGVDDGRSMTEATQVVGKKIWAGGVDMTGVHEFGGLAKLGGPTGIWGRLSFGPGCWEDMYFLREQLR